jgi:peptidoglycan hydrolase-like amidase
MPVDDELVSVVSMDLETAVASVVAAEQIASTPLEALKAQAIAARSYLVASRGRHRGFDFCDTTHCQFLREPPAPNRRAAQAARDTAGQVIAYRDRTIPAFYSASCGGHTLTLADVGRPAADGYPYFSVECAYCGHHMNGQRQGHGLGLCQVGAADLAATRHATCADILAHYYPGTNLMGLKLDSAPRPITSVSPSASRAAETYGALRGGTADG